MISAMGIIYYNLIIASKKTIDDVPEDLRHEVEFALGDVDA